MDGKGRWIDNVFIERLWRSLKHEEVYLKAYEDVAAARRGIGDYFKFYNQQRPHYALARSSRMRYTRVPSTCQRRRNERLFRDEDFT